MRAELLVENVENFLPVFSKILPTHSQIPVLSNLLLEATKQGLFIYATNLELGARIKIPAKIKEEGATTVPGRQFIEALSSLPKDKIELFLDKDTLVVSSRGNKLSFQTITREEYPNIFEQKGEKVHVFKKEDMRRIFSKLLFAVSQDESRPELTGILILQKSETLDLVATDGFRMSVRRIKSEKILEEGDHLIIPTSIIAETLSLKGEDDVTVYVYRKANQVIFESGDVILVGRLIGGEFPNYEKVIPQNSATTAVADVSEFLQELKVASVFAKEAANIIHLKIEKNQMRIFSKSSGLGEGEVTLDIEQGGEGNEISFNTKFLSDILRNIDEKTVKMGISSPVEPAMYTIPEDPEFTHIIMPVRVQE